MSNPNTGRIEKTRKSGNHNRGGLPRALWMAMLKDINRGPTQMELAIAKRQEEENKAIARMLKRGVTELLSGTGIAA